MTDTPRTTITVTPVEPDQTLKRIWGYRIDMDTYESGCPTELTPEGLDFFRELLASGWQPTFCKIDMDRGILTPKTTICSAVFILNQDNVPSLHFFPGEVPKETLDILVDKGLFQAQLLGTFDSWDAVKPALDHLTERSLSEHSTPDLDDLFEFVLDWIISGKTEEELEAEEELDEAGTPVDITVTVEYHNEPISVDDEYDQGSIVYHLNQ